MRQTGCGSLLDYNLSARTSVCRPYSNVGILLQEELSPVIWPKPSQLLIRRQCHQAVGGGTGKMIGWRENFRHIAHSLFVTLKLMNKISLPTAAEEKDDWRLPGAPSVVL